VYCVSKIHITVVVPVVLCGSDTWSLILRAFDKNVLRRIFGLKRQEVTGRDE